MDADTLNRDKVCGSGIMETQWKVGRLILKPRILVRILTTEIHLMRFSKMILESLCQGVVYLEKGIFLFLGA